MKKFPKVLALAVFGPWALFFLFIGIAQAEVCEGTGFVPATLDPLHKGSLLTLSGGNLTVTHNATAAWHHTFGTVSSATGKYYFEVYINSNAPHSSIGVGSSSSNPDDRFLGWFWSYDGYYKNPGTYIAHAGFSTADVISVAVDFDGGKIWFAQNGTWTQGNPAAGTGAVFTASLGTLYPAIAMDGAGTITARFAAESFSYAPPAGFGAWQTGAPETCTGKYVCSAATSSACSAWVEVAGETVATFESIGLDGPSITTAFGVGLGMVLAFVGLGLGFGSIQKILSAVFGGRDA